MVAFAQEQWNIDPARLLLTGMSDGGTFTYVSGLQSASPFTHLAPISASFHPLLLEMMDAGRIKDLPIYLTHGALDWMFPIDVARSARQALSAAGADLRYREIEDLSHTYPSDENQHILDWFLPA
jgi:phospholipase/carboxylesterase